MEDEPSIQSNLNKWRRRLPSSIRNLADAKRADAPVWGLEELVAKLFDLAIAGDVAAAKLVLAYLEGMPVARVQAEVGPMPQFTADEAAEAERLWSDFRAELLARESGAGRGRDTGTEAPGAA